VTSFNYVKGAVIIHNSGLTILRGFCLVTSVVESFIVISCNVKQFMKNVNFNYIFPQSFGLSLPAFTRHFNLD
jgi:hypothetical protein